MAYHSQKGVRHLLTTPYLPDRTELIGNDTGQASAIDIGKAVKLSGNAVVAAASGNDIYGFISSVEAGTSGGYSVGAVACDVGREAIAIDEAGGLAVGDLVVAGTAVALGTAGGGNVISGSPAIHKWQVIGIEGAASTAGEQILLRKV